MQDFHDATPISILEDLDPEPEEKARRNVRIELILGVALLLGVLGWVGWQWAGQQHDASEYAIARQAADKQDWETARSHFTEAGNYRDAPARAREADRMITDRDQHYAVALLSATFGQWAVSLQAARSVQQIEPGFRTSEVLENNAVTQVYEQALSGTLALRTHTQNPGIYYRTGGGWQWLKGSDRYSEVLGIGTPDHTVFDVPGVGWVPPKSANQGQARLFGRSLMEADLSGGKVTTKELRFDPAIYGLYVWGAKGVWAVRYSLWAPDDQKYGRIDSIYASFVMEYQAWDGADTKIVNIPAPNWFVMDLGRDGEHILIAEMADSNTRESRLYVAGPDGSDRRLIFSSPGTFESARFSPDGKYVLVTVNSYSDYTSVEGAEQSIVLVDISGEPKAHPIVKKSLAVPCSPRDCEVTSAVFMNNGLLRGKILLAEWAQGSGSGQSLLTLRDPQNPDQTLHTVSIDGSPPTYSQPAWVNEEPGGDAVTVSWRQGQSDHMTVAVLGNEQNKAAQVAWAAADSSGWRVMRANHLVMYRYLEPGSPSENARDFSITSLPLANLNDGTTEYKVLQSQYSLPGDFSVASSWFAGPQLLAYTKGDVLHARTYDGVVDVALESGISTFFYLPYTELSYLR